MNLKHVVSCKNILLLAAIVTNTLFAHAQVKTTATPQTKSLPGDTLKEVTIKANKLMMERKIDRTVFNIENSMAAKGTDLTQALALVPMLRVDAQGIAIVGKSGVSVMINNRILNLDGADLMSYLKSLRSDNIEKIEVITTPPAKYDAQGNSGMINILMKKNPAQGWSGSISSTYAQTTYPENSNNINLNYQSQKLSSSIKLRQYHRMTHPTEEINIIGSNSILSSDSRKDTNYGFGANLSLDYKMNQKSNVGFIYDIGKLNSNMNVENNTVYKTKTLIDSILNTYSEQRNVNLSQTISVYHDQKIGKSGQKLSSGFNFFSTLPETTVNFHTESNQPPGAEFVKNASNIAYKIWSAQSDLTLPNTIAFIEMGGKFTNFDNNSDVKYYNLVQEDYTMDISKSNIFQYNEKNIAGYISVQKDLTKTWSGKAGLRYEYSIIDGYSPAANEKNKFQYGKLFPSIYFTYKPGNDNTFSFSYSKRINRPNFRALNPFRWYANPYIYSTGNPLLQPSFNHNFEMAYLYKGILSFTVYSQKLVNGYGRLIEIKNAFKITNYKNYLSQYNSGLEATLDIKFFPWWENREFASLNFSNAQSAIPEVLTKNGYAFYYTTYNTFEINKTLNVFLNFRHSLPGNDGNTFSKSRYNLSSGIKAALADNKIQLNLSVDDIFKSAITRGEVRYQDFLQTFNNYYDSRRFSLSVTYAFGKDKVKGNRKQVNFKETQRAN